MIAFVMAQVENLEEAAPVEAQNLDAVILGEQFYFFTVVLMWLIHAGFMSCRAGVVRRKLVGRDEAAGGAAEHDRPQRPAVIHAAGHLEHLAQRDPEGRLVDPGLLDRPERQNRRVPVEPSVPILAYSRPPSMRMPGTLTSVSTLLITVGLSNRPSSTGNGGLLRGSPR